MARTAPAGTFSQMRRKSSGLPELLRLLVASEFNTAFDYMHTRAHRMVEREETANAILLVRELCELIVESGDESRPMSDIHAALLSVLTALHIESSRPDEALVTGAEALNILSREPRRKDEPFMAILASLLFDLAQVHASRGELKQAEREIEKSAKILERVARTDAERYGPGHIMALDASTGIYRSRVKQANLLAHYQVATSTYMELVNAGGDDESIRVATGNLIDSLVTQGTTLMQMGRQREAVGYFTRALKFLTRIEPDFSPRALSLSIDLGEALVASKSTRDKGVHLLNTMLHKATKLREDDQHRRIVEILLNVKTNRLDILSIWHKVFPK